MGSGCGNGCMKCCLFIFNIFFLVSRAASSLSPNRHPLFSCTGGGPRGDGRRHLPARQVDRVHGHLRDTSVGGGRDHGDWSGHLSGRFLRLLWCSA